MIKEKIDKFVDKYIEATFADGSSALGLLKRVCDNDLIEQWYSIGNLRFRVAYVRSARLLTAEEVKAANNRKPCAHVNVCQEYIKRWNKIIAKTCPNCKLYEPKGGKLK